VSSGAGGRRKGNRVEWGCRRVCWSGGGGVDESSSVTRMGKFLDRAAPSAFKGAQCGSGV
jgi:hypothetical protein